MLQAFKNGNTTKRSRYATNMWTASSGVETVRGVNFDTVLGLKLALLLFSVRPGMALKQRIETETMCNYNYCFVGSKIGANASVEDLALKRHTRRISLAGANCAYVALYKCMNKMTLSIAFTLHVSSMKIVSNVMKS